MASHGDGGLTSSGAFFRRQRVVRPRVVGQESGLEDAVRQEIGSFTPREPATPTAAATGFQPRRPEPTKAAAEARTPKMVSPRVASRQFDTSALVSPRAAAPTDPAVPVDTATVGAQASVAPPVAVTKKPRRVVEQPAPSSVSGSWQVAAARRQISKRISTCEDIHYMLKQVGVNLDPARVESEPAHIVSLQQCDDTSSYDGRTLEDWAALVEASKVSDGARHPQPLKAKALRKPANIVVPSNGVIPYVGQFAQCSVLDVLPVSETIMVQWTDTESIATLTRLEVCFDLEDAVRFCMRVAAAHTTRTEVENAIRYNFYVDCMPVDDSVQPAKDQMRRITNSSLSAPRTPRTGSTLPELLAEVKLNWQRTMNLILLQQASKARAAEDILTPVSGGVPPSAAPTTKRAAPYYGTVDSQAPPFSALSAAFTFNSCLTKTEVVSVLYKVHEECMRVAPSRILCTAFPRSCSLQEFRSEQLKWGGNIWEVLRVDWRNRVASVIRNGLATVGKGWFNIQESDPQVFEFSKLYRFLVMVRLMMQDTLRKLTMASLNSYVDFIIERSTFRVQVLAPNQVIVQPPFADVATVRRGVERHLAGEADAEAAVDALYILDESSDAISREQRVRILQVAPPLFELEVSVSLQQAVLNPEEVAASEARLAEWQTRHHRRRSSAMSVAGPIAGGKSRAASIAYSEVSEDDDMQAEVSTTEHTIRDPAPQLVAPIMGYCFVYDQRADDFAEAVLSTFDRALAAMSDIKEVTPLVMQQLLHRPQAAISFVSLTESGVQQYRRLIAKAVEDGSSALQPYLESFKPHLELLNLNVEAELVKLAEELKVKIDLPSLLTAIKFHQTQERVLADTLPVSMNIGMYRVRTAKIRTLLISKHHAMAEGIMGAIKDWAVNLTRMVQQETDNSKQRLRGRTKNIEELAEMRKFAAYVKETLPRLQEMISEATQCKAALEQFLFRMDFGDHKSMWKAMEATGMLVDQLQSVASLLDKRQDSLLEDMVVEQSNFKEQLERLSREVADFNNVKDDSAADVQFHRVQAVEGKIAQAEHQAGVFNSRESLIGLPLTSYAELHDIRRQFHPFSIMWTAVYKWRNNFAEWKTTPVMHLDATIVDRETAEARSHAAQCVRIFFRQGNQPCAGIAGNLRASVDQFLPLVPVISALRTPGMRDRHWSTLKTKTGLELGPSMNSTIMDLVQDGILSHDSTVREVAAVASNEYHLETTLKSMADVWKTKRLAVEPYLNTGTCVLKGVAELFALLDEHLTLTQSMLFSSYKAPFEDQIEKWNRTLGLAVEVLDEWVLVQKAWLYLSPIFESPDIARQLPTESKRFATVDSNWRRTMQSALTATDALGFLSSDKLLQKFKESMRFLNTVQKGLADYLENKRLAFPRFYFLSNDDLLELLSQTKEVGRVQDQLPKCFEGIYRVEFSKAFSPRNSDFSSPKARRRAFAVDSSRRPALMEGVEDAQVTTEHHIASLLSAGGERLPLQSSVVPADRGVETWMKDVETEMLRSVRGVHQAALSDYLSNTRTKWMQEWPAMAAMAASQIVWTMEVEQALTRKAGVTLQSLYQQQVSQLEDMVALVRGRLPPLATMTVGSMTVLDVHARDVVKQLMDHNVHDISSFEWLSKMRYYWRMDDVAVEMATSIQPYGYEYLGNSFRLVVTPLTEKCYLTCMLALEMTLGGAPAGPAGTGKTETVKDMAKALAKQCVVFNCSEGLDHLSMGKFFKGLAFCGAWACFDEFNRIDVEVLSVVAQQIVTLQSAVRAGVREVPFEGTQVIVDPRFSVFITMNPGYAGRAELPGNLKALFRPVAMMVPDYALIGEIMFFAYGFSNARALANKMVSTFKLCSEQLSVQPHYDYGMRAVKSVISAAGELRRISPASVDEQVILCRALFDMNLPKFLKEDIPLFQGIMADLFPDIERSKPVQPIIVAALRQTSISAALQPTPYFITKCVQLYDTVCTRHGVMIVGASGSGKSTITRTLQKALGAVADGKVLAGAKLQHVDSYILNPKSVTMGQLYGEFDDTTREWRDGVLAMHIRNASGDKSPHLKWIIADGPVDAQWIENLNTVLDDTKKLCLSSGQIIPLTPTMTLMFEVDSLDYASPATISRCGMIHMDASLLGEDVLVGSWMQRNAPKQLFSGAPGRLHQLLDGVLAACLAFVRKHCVEDVKSTNFQLTATLLRLLEVQLRLLDKHVAATAPANASSADMLDEEAPVQDSSVDQSVLDSVFAFCVVWSLGASITFEYRQRFSCYLAQELRNMGAAIPLEDDANWHDYRFDLTTRTWSKWQQVMSTSPYAHDSTVSFSEVFIPTPESESVLFWLSQMVSNRQHVLLVGQTGTGKSAAVVQYLTRKSGERELPLVLALSARTKSHQLQSFVDDKCEKRKRTEFGPPVGSSFVLFIDDLNMPAVEAQGAQPPLELLRQFLCQGGWYDLKSMMFRSIVDTVLVCAMAPPGGGRNDITARLPRHFNQISCPPLSDWSKNHVLHTVLQGFLSVGFSQSLQGMIKSLTQASISVYNTVRAQLLPTPSKVHYTFNLRDLFKVLQGLLMADSDSTSTPVQMCRLWVHETRRAFQDRLVSDMDKRWFGTVVRLAVQESLGFTWADIMGDNASVDAFLLFGSYADQQSGRYREVTERGTQLANMFQEWLQDYNSEITHRMNLVMFHDAIEHVSRVARVLRLPEGHTLLLGLSGSGRQSVTRLAAFMAEFPIKQPNPTKSYSVGDWREELKAVLFQCGLEDHAMVLLLADRHLVHEEMLEDVNSLLVNADVPGIFSADEQERIFLAMKFQCQLKNLPHTRLNAYGQYLMRVRRNLHIALAMTPVGSEFRDRLRMFPGLVNCCTIDWYGPWPNEALECVARACLGLPDPDMVGAPGTSASVVASVCPVDLQPALVAALTMVHQTTGEFNAKYLEQYHRYNYVTPTSFLGYMQTFGQLLALKVANLKAQQDRLQAGLHKLRFTNEQVLAMQKSLIELQPQLEATQQEVDRMMVDLTEDRQRVAATKQSVEADEAEAQKQADATKAIADEAEADLTSVMPILQAALDNLSKLNKSDIDEVRSMTRPPMGVRLTMEAACVLFNVAPVTRVNAMGEREVDYWEASQRRLLSDGRAFLAQMVSFDKDNISDRTISALESYMNRPEFQPEVMDQVSKACAGVCRWIRAMYHYHHVLRDVEPKKQTLLAAQGRLDVTMQKLNAAKERLRQVTERLETLEATFNQALRRKEGLAEQIVQCTARVESARKLTSGLGNEADRWNTTVTSLSGRLANVIGDVVVAAGTLSYLGPYSGQYRDNLVALWNTRLTQMAVPHSENITMLQVLQHPERVQQWMSAGLPSDSVSLQNAIMMHYSTRAVVLIDPQGQASKFLRTLGSGTEQLEILSPDDKGLMRALEAAVRFGRWVLIEGIDDKIDPALGPVLSCTLTTLPGQSDTQYLRIGDTMVPYNSSFKLFMTTNMPNPHFSPEVCVQVSLLNFTLTPEALEEQLLAAVISHDLPALEERRTSLVSSNARMASELRSVEEKILGLLSSSSDSSLLDDTNLIQALSRAKDTAKEIEAKMQEVVETERDITSSRDAYRPIAHRGSILFFTVSELATVDHMYQYSLRWFRQLFEQCIMLTPMSEDLQQRIAAVNDRFSYQLYQVVGRSLFDEHKLLFSFLLSARIAQGGADWDATEWRFFLSGQAGAGESLASRRALVFEWLSHRSSTELITLSTLPRFSALITHMKDHEQAWKSWAELPSTADVLAVLPAPWGSTTLLQQMCIVRALKPDSLTTCCQRFVSEVLGAKYALPCSYNLRDSYEASSPTAPLLFVISPGSDPLRDVSDFAWQMGAARSLRTVSLGKGQGPNALRMIKEGASKGQWVMLMNCHLFTSWLPTLAQLVNELDDDSTHRGFRLWLTSEPTAAFPSSVLQKSIKMTQERPNNLRTNMKASYERFTNDTFAAASRPHLFGKAAYALCFFHASICERRRFGPLGWNALHEFADADLEISLLQLRVFLEKYSEVPFEVLNRLVGDVNYGGRVTDDKDLRCLMTILGSIVVPDVMSDGFRFSSSSHYVSVPYNEVQPLKGYMEAIERLPLSTSPEVFGMHNNANISTLMHAGYKLVDNIMSLAPRSDAVQAESRDTTVTSIAASLRSQVPEQLDMEKAITDFPTVYEQSLNAVIIQEVARYNRLLAVISASLSDLQRAVAGEVVMSAELEAMSDALCNQWVPRQWSAVSFPSLKPLSAWFAELTDRVAFIHTWLHHGAPNKFWLGGLFFPQAFLTAMLQNFARKHKHAIDTVSFSFGSVNEDQTAVEDGCLITGIYLEGCKWSASANHLVEPSPRELFSVLPTLHLLPCTKRDPLAPQTYRCPLYRTASRRGTLSTTGHSTNFVMWLDMPCGRHSIQRPALVSEVGPGIHIGDMITDCEAFVKAGAAALLALRY